MIITHNIQMMTGENTPPISSLNISAKPANKAKIQALLYPVYTVSAGLFVSSNGHT